MAANAMCVCLRRFLMQKTVTLLLAVAALLAFAACVNDPGNTGSDNSGPDNTDPGNTITTPAITWTAAADGSVSAVDSTKITFTFSDTVSGLIAADITLSPLTVSAVKGALSGSGASYTLNITAANQGYISVAIAKNGVATAAQEVRVFKEAVNPITANVKTYIDGGEQVVFAAPADNSGAYTLNSQEKDADGIPVVDGDHKWIWQPQAEGSYTWNKPAQTITLTVNKIADDDGTMTAKASALPLFVGWMQGEIDKEIENRLKWSANAPYNETQTDAEAAVLETRNDENGTAYASLSELINALAAIRLDETFAVCLYTYVFSSDGESLILLESLPASVGTDELAGKTYSGTISDWATGASQKNANHTYAFSAVGTYIETYYDGVEATSTYSGYYAYNSTAKRVYLKPAIRNGKTPEQFYATTEYFEDFNRYPTEADHRTSETYQHFKIADFTYNPTTNVVDSKDSGELEGL